MPRPSLLTAFHRHISGLLTTRIHTSLDIVINAVFVVSLSSFIVLSCFPESVAKGAELPVGWLSWRYPNPRSDPEKCGWTDVVQWAGDSIRTISWICDPDHIIGYHEAYNLALELERFQRESQCDCPRNCSHGGYRIAIALVHRLNTDGDFEPMKTKAKNFANDVRVSWFMDDGCDDNVLIFYSYYDDELYISIGEITERVISDIELVHLNKLGDQALIGRVPTTPPPPAGALQLSVNASTTVPSSTTDFGMRRTTTSAGLQVLLREVSVAIINGPSVSSKLVYGAVIPVILVLIIFTMCLLANWCCRPSYGGYHLPAQNTHEKKEKDEEEGAEEKGEKLA